MTDEFACFEPQVRETPEVLAAEAPCPAPTPKRRGRTGKPLPEMVEGGRLFAEVLRRTRLEDDYEGYIPCVWTVAVAQYAAECNPEFVDIRRALSVQFGKGLSAAGLQGHTLSGGVRVWTLPGAVEQFETEYGCSPLTRVHPQFRLYPDHVKRRKRRASEVSSGANGGQVEPSAVSDKSAVPGFEAGSFLSRVATAPVGAWIRQVRASAAPRPGRLLFPFVVLTFDATCTVFRAVTVDDLLRNYEDCDYEPLDRVMERVPRMKNQSRKKRAQAVEPDASTASAPSATQSDVNEGDRGANSGEEGEPT